MTILCIRRIVLPYRLHCLARHGFALDRTMTYPCFSPDVETNAILLGPEKTRPGRRGLADRLWFGDVSPNRNHHGHRQRHHNSPSDDATAGARAGLTRGAGPVAGHNEAVPLAALGSASIVHAWLNSRRTPPA